MIPSVVRDPGKVISVVTGIPETVHEKPRQGDLWRQQSRHSDADKEGFQCGDMHPETNMSRGDDLSDHMGQKNAWHQCPRQGKERMISKPQCGTSGFSGEGRRNSGSGTSNE